MTRSRLLGLIGVTTLGVASSWAGPLAHEAHAQAAGGAAALQYRLVPDWPRLPTGMQLGEVNGVDVDDHGHVFVFHRAERGFEPEAVSKLTTPVVVRIDAATGEIGSTWGADLFVLPHGLTVDDENNVWVTDVGLHQIFKFSHDGELLLTLGEAGVPGWDPGHFNLPTDVAILPDGSFYVSDGYANSRVARFDREGRFISEWGSPGAGPSQFENPHGITIGSDGNLIVSDRQNSRLQIFDTDGRLLSEWLGARPVGRVFAAAVGTDGKIYVGVRQRDYDALSTGVIVLDLEWNPIARIGFSAEGDAVFSSVHDVAVGPDGAIYVAETRGKRVLKFEPVR
jgi:peptidylamidoglycolate lyase